MSCADSRPDSGTSRSVDEPQSLSEVVKPRRRIRFVSVAMGASHFQVHAIGDNEREPAADVAIRSASAGPQLPQSYS